MELEFKLKQFGFRIHALKIAELFFFFCADFPNILNTIPYANITNHTLQSQIESRPLHFANVGELCGSRKEGVHNKS